MEEIVVAEQDRLLETDRVGATTLGGGEASLWAKLGEFKAPTGADPRTEYVAGNSAGLDTENRARQQRSNTTSTQQN